MMKLENFKVRELSKVEMMQINGGGKLGDALKAAWDAICNAVDWVVYKIEEWYYQKRQEYYNSFSEETNPEVIE